MRPVLYAMPGNQALAEGLARRRGIARLDLQLHRFPDGEARVRVQPPPAGSEAMVVCTLNRPDDKILPLLMVAATLREVGAGAVGLIAPYLAYLRQDRRFRPGEAVSSVIFGRLLATYFDWQITVDPHLHRLHSLAQAGMPHGSAVSAAPALAGWIRAHVPRPLLIGPDEESAQWVEPVAGLLAAPVVVAQKRRCGDREVALQLPDITRWRGLTPVLLDDIASSGETLLRAARDLRRLGWPAPWCVLVHGLLVANARQRLRAAGVAGIITTNSVPAATAQIDLSAILAAALPG